MHLIIIIIKKIILIIIYNIATTTSTAPYIAYDTNELVKKSTFDLENQKKKKITQF